MTNEDIERNFKIIAENQVRHSEDIKQIDESIAVLNQTMNDLAKIQKEHGERFDAHLAKIDRFEIRFDQQLNFLNSLLNHFIETGRQTNGRLERIEANIERLSEAQIKTDEQIRALAHSSLKPESLKRARRSIKKGKST
jgi:ABC-type transporter Mla subunit MlaD